jgi:hypothetical protein
MESMKDGFSKVSKNTGTPSFSLSQSLYLLAHEQTTHHMATNSQEHGAEHTCYVAVCAGKQGQ